MDAASVRGLQGMNRAPYSVVTMGYGVRAIEYCRIFWHA